MKLFFSILMTLSLLVSNGQLQNFNHNGINRQYIYYEPPNLPSNAPLVVVLHGYTGSANGIKNYCGMNAVADNNGFAVCYPQGTSDSWGNKFWNVGYDFHWNENVDDVDFLVQLVQHLQIQHNLSSQNTFSTGMSNGGEMSYMLACQQSQIFKAIASVSGTMFNSYWNTCGSSVIPVMEIHGTNDNVNLWAGDYSNSTGWGVFYDIDSIISLWVNNNNCTQFINSTLPDLNTSDGSYVETDKYTNGTNNNEVWLYRVVGGEHDWPGAFGNMDINSSEEIWLFFSQFISTSTHIESENYISNKKRALILRTDLLGRPINGVYNGIVIYIYSDGTVEKKFELKP